MPVWIAYFFQVGAGVIAASPEKCGEQRHEVSGEDILASVLAHFEQPIMEHSYSEDRVRAGAPLAGFACGVFDLAVHFKSATPAFAAATRKPLSSVASGKVSRLANSRYTAS